MDENTQAINEYLQDVPCLSEDEYEDLFGLKQRVQELRAIRSDAFDAIDNLKQQLELAQNQFDNINQSLRSTNQQFELKFRELMAKYGVNGGNISVADTAPHYITTN
jgi:hypothetical protein